MAAPLELATALTGLATGPAGSIGGFGLALAFARGLAVAVGLIVGRQIMQRADTAASLARTWAVADLGTLALVLATDVLPSNRLPGTGLLVFGLYATLAIVVLLVAREEAAGAASPRR